MFISTVSPLYPWVPHPQIQPTIYKKYSEKISEIEFEFAVHLQLFT